MESKHSTQSVIAKLMGLDELPHWHPVRKKQTVLSENYLQKVASVGGNVKHASHGRSPFRMNIELKREFENVFGAVETLDKDKHHITSAENVEGNAGSLKAKMTVTGSQLNCAEWLSVTKKLEALMESLDFEVLDSKEEHFLKYLQEPTTLSTKHLNKHQDIPHFSQSGNIALLKSDVPKTGDTDICRNSVRITKQGNLKIPGKINNELQKSVHGEISGKIFRFSRSRLESKDEVFQSRRIVSKSNPAKAENAVGCFPLPSSCRSSYLEDEGDKRFSSPASARIYPKVKGRKTLTCHMANIPQCPRVLSKIPDEISGQTKHGEIKLSKLVSSAIGDDDTSAGRYEMLKSSSKHFNKVSQFHYVFSCSNKSYMADEAKKKVSEQWTVTGTDQQVRRGQEITLGELLTTCDQESGRGNLYYKPGNHGLSNKNNSSDKKINFSIRGHYGLKVKHEIKSPMFRPLSAASSTRTCNIRARSKDYILHNFWSLRPKKSLNWATNNNSTKPTSKWALSMVTDVVANPKTQIVGRPPANQKTQQFEPITSIFLGRRDYDSSRHVSETSVQQETSIGFHEDGSVYSLCSMTEPDSHVNLEEAYQHNQTSHPSPISVLDLQFREEISSSSESLDVVGVDICDSFTDTEEPGMNVSSDEDFGEGSVGDSEEAEDVLRLSRVEESRDFSYLVEVLTESGFYSGSLHTDFSTWYSTECPISPSVFEILEKKFGEQTFWKRSDRRLLFDRINLGLMEILQPCMGIPSWDMPVSRRLNLKPSHDMIEEDLWTLLVVQERESIKDSAENIFGRDVRWSELGDDIDVNVKETVKLLIDELVAEIVCLESFEKY